VDVGEAAGARKEAGADDSEIRPVGESARRSIVEGSGRGVVEP